MHLWVLVPPGRGLQQRPCFPTLFLQAALILDQTASGKCWAQKRHTSVFLSPWDLQVGLAGLGRVETPCSVSAVPRPLDPA